MYYLCGKFGNTTIMKRRIYAIITAAACAAIAAAAAPDSVTLQLDDFVLAQARPAAPAAWVSASDGKGFYRMNENRIELFDFATGKRQRVIADLAALTPERQWEGFDVAGNGRAVLLYERSRKIYRHSFSAFYYVYNPHDKSLVPLDTAARQEIATLSPDGGRVAYVKDNDIYLYHLADGRTERVTTDGRRNSVINGVADWVYQEEFGIINSLQFSSDGRKLAFIRWDESQVKEYSMAMYEGSCDPEPDYHLYPGEYRFKYPVAGEKNSDVEVRIYDLASGSTVTAQLPIDAEDYIPKIDYPAGRDELMIMTIDRWQEHFRLFAANGDTGVCREVYSDSSSSWLNIEDITAMTRYGRDDFVTCATIDDRCHLVRYDYSGHRLEQVTRGDYDVTAYYGYDAERRCHYVQTNSGGATERSVARVDAAGSLSLLSPEKGWASAQFGDGLHYFVLNYSDLTTPNRYTLYAADGRRVRDIELNEGFAKIYTAPSVPHRVLTTCPGDSATLNGYIIYPPHFDASKRYPLIMSHYGGPGSQEVRNRWELDWEEWAAMQGYIVACFDGRGTGGRGKDWEALVYQCIGQLESRDQVAAARYMATLPYVDAEHIAIYGWSYGGYMTLMAMSQPDAPYCCGIAIAPVTDWRYYDTVYTERFMRTPDANPEGYARASAISLAPQLKGRLFIASGSADDNVHLINTMQYTAALTAEARTFDMMLYTNMNHSINFCNVRLPLYRRIMEFLDYNMKQ